MAEAGLLREGESLYDPQNIRLMHHLNAALRAHAIYKRDVEYIVRGGEVIIVDEFTGRTMPGRRWSDGLHQAVEAKEGVKVRAENQTVASITFQNYFRLYKKLSGMTGTADTEAPEFMQIYGLEVVVIPTHRPMIRKDNADFVYLNQADKFKAIIEDIEDCVSREQPVLVGTTSIETSELLSGVLKENGIRARSAQRQAARARGAHHRERRHAGQSDHRHEYGGSRYRHQTRWQQRSRARAGRRRRGRSGARRNHRRAHPRRLAGAPRQGGRRRRPAHHRHRTPRVAPHRQPVARPFGPPGRSGFEPLLSIDGRQPHAHLRRSESHEEMAGHGRHEGRRSHRERPAHAPDREGAAQGRSRTTSTSASSCSRSTTWPTTSARSSTSSAPSSWAPPTWPTRSAASAPKWSAASSTSICRRTSATRNGTSTVSPPPSPRVSRRRWIRRSG